MIATKAECWRLNSTLEWLDNSEHHNDILEMDCRLVLDDANKDKLNLSQYGVILQDYKTLLSRHNNYKIVFTKRQANGSTYALTRAALSYASCNIFYLIQRCIANEMS